MKHILSMLFFMVFLLAGGAVIGVNNYAYLSTHTFEVALVSFSSFSALSIIIFWDAIKSRILGDKPQ